MDRGTVQDARATGEGRRRPATLLLLEADRDVRGLMMTWLAPLGYRVLEAEEPAAARALLARGDRPVDLLVTGIALLGGTNGAALAAEVRRDHPRTAVLIASGYVDRAGHQPGSTQGVHLLGKPFTRRHLVESVRAALAERPRDAA